MSKTSKHENHRKKLWREAFLVAAKELIIDGGSNIQVAVKSSTFASSALLDFDSKFQPPIPKLVVKKDPVEEKIMDIEENFPRNYTGWLKEPIGETIICYLKTGTIQFGFAADGYWTDTKAIPNPEMIIATNEEVLSRLRIEAERRNLIDDLDTVFLDGPKLIQQSRKGTPISLLDERGVWMSF